MANTFKVKTKAGGAVGANTDMTVYTVPSSTTAVLVGLTISSLVVTQGTVDIKLENADGDNIHVGKDIPLPSGSSLNALAGKIVMETGDILKVQCDTANAVDIALSLMEVT